MQECMWAPAGRSKKISFVLGNVYRQTHVIHNINNVPVWHPSCKLGNHNILVSPDNQQKASGLYRLQCNTCSKSYVGQTGRSVATRYREHIRYIKTNNPLSGYTIHILNNRHEYGTPKHSLQLLQTCRKGTIMNCWEALHIQSLQ